MDFQQPELEKREDVPKNKNIRRRGISFHHDSERVFDDNAI